MTSDFSNNHKHNKSQTNVRSQITRNSASSSWGGIDTTNKYHKRRSTNSTLTHRERERESQRWELRCANKTNSAGHLLPLFLFGVSAIARPRLLPIALVRFRRLCRRPPSPRQARWDDSGLMLAGRAARRRRPDEALPDSLLFPSSLASLWTLPVSPCNHGMRNWIWIDTVLFPLYLCFSHALPRPWIFDAGMYEPLYLTFDAYPSVVPPVRVRGVMALFLAVSILWALIW